MNSIENERWRSVKTGKIFIHGVKTPADHIRFILHWFTDTLTSKYHRGQQEHGGLCFEKPNMLQHAEEEILDLVVYHKTAKDQLARMALDGQSAMDAYTFLYGEPPQ